MFFFLVAHIIPVINYIRYYRFKKAIVASSVVNLGAHGANTLGNAEAEDAAKKAAKKALDKIIADNSKRQEGSITFNADFLLNADADGDGMMSLEEALAQDVTEETFLAMDADGDGQVTKDEFKAWLEAGRLKPPLATENLLENIWRLTPTLFSWGRQPATFCLCGRVLY